MVAHNNGGTANEGQDTSPPQTFTITVTPTVTPLSSDQSFLNRVYQDLLHRAVDPAGQANWMSQLAAGVDAAQVASSVEQSVEYRTDELQGLYQQFLGRAADPAGLALWLQARAQGSTLLNVEAAFLGSPEYSQRHGGATDAAFLGSLYQDALGRAIDSGGQAAWSAQLAGGASRSQVALAILQSTEARTGLVENLYQTLLHRPADQAGLAAALTALANGIAPDQIERGILESTEYTNGA